MAENSAPLVSSGRQFILEVGGLDPGQRERLAIPGKLFGEIDTEVETSAELLITPENFAELVLLIEIGQKIGLWNTIAIVVLTGFIGAALARSEGFGIISRIQNELASGQLPGDSLIDGALVLAGALLLLTPGLITDAFGFALLLPFSRAFVKIYLKKYFNQKINTGEIHVNYKIEDS
ncbi:FxsA family protein [candidate division KSB1 bacterium]|nr:FxsA family protein [candidate division KSB1 bacterium]